MCCLKTSRQKVSGIRHIIFSAVYPSPKIVVQISVFCGFNAIERGCFCVKIKIKISLENVLLLIINLLRCNAKY